MSYFSSVVYEGIGNCGENYIGERQQNVTIRWDEHSEIKVLIKPIYMPKFKVFKWFKSFY